LGAALGTKPMNKAFADFNSSLSGKEIERNQSERVQTGKLHIYARLHKKLLNKLAVRLIAQV
jgi:hypothetical protein